MGTIFLVFMIVSGSGAQNKAGRQKTHSKFRNVAGAVCTPAFWAFARSVNWVKVELLETRYARINAAHARPNAYT